MGNNNGTFHYSKAHSNFTVKWSIKTEHSAFKAVVTRGSNFLNCVTRVTFGTHVTMFKTLWFGVKRPDMCNIVSFVTILSSTI